MSWGDDRWGISPWGGSAPSVNGEVGVISVRFITPTLLRVHLTTEVVVNSFYEDPDNYQIRLHTPTPGGISEVPPEVTKVTLRVIRVLPLHNGEVVSDFIYLETEPHTIGLNYELKFLSLTTLDGMVGGMFSYTPYAARVTKTMAALKSLPAHFDKRADSLLLNIVAAISMQDDTQGGSRSDEFP